MGRRAATLIVFAASLALAAAASGSLAGQTMRLGRGLGPWHLGMKRTVAKGLQRSVANRPTGMGCLTAVLPENASLVDDYPGLRLGWTGDRKSGFRLLDVASTKAGDRTDAGFVVGTSTLAQVRKRYPKAHPQTPTAWHGTKLGSRVVVVYFPKGAEFGDNMLYWFDGGGLLRVIETNNSGC
jgi:hypothetical protein